MAVADHDHLGAGFFQHGLHLRHLWLLPEQREWLQRTLAGERDELEATHGTFSAWRAMIDPRVLTLCLVYIGCGTISYGVAYFLPQIIKGIGLSVLATGFVTAIPAAGKIRHARI